MLEKYLPIGTIVLLKNAKKRVMITGFCIESKDKNGEMFDYCGCLYPEGVISLDKVMMFNHEQIVKIYYLGLIDSSEIEFKKSLTNYLNEQEKSKKDEKSQSSPIKNIEEL